MGLSLGLQAPHGHPSKRASRLSISSSLSFRAWAPLGTAVSRGGTVKPIAPGENSFLPGADPPLAPRPSGSLPVPARRRRLPRRPRPHALRTGSARRGRGGQGGQGGLLCCRTAGPARPRRAPHTQQPRAGRSLEAVFLRPRCRPYRLQQRCLLPRVFVGSAAAQRWEGTCRTLARCPWPPGGAGAALLASVWALVLSVPRWALGHSPQQVPRRSACLWRLVSGLLLPLGMALENAGAHPFGVSMWALPFTERHCA